MFGIRPEGRRVKGQDPILTITPYLMPMRCDAQVMLSHELDYNVLVNYVADQAKKGNSITFMELMIAAYVRGISQVPQANRFICNKQYYKRSECTVSFTLLMDTPDGSLEENVVKIFFDPTDTVYDVSRRVKAAIAMGRKADDPGFAVKLAGGLLKVPGLATVVVGLVRLMDRYGLLPKAFIDELPFFSGMFITNMASLGVNMVNHHIYNFGNVSLFFSLGNPSRGYTVDAKGNPVRKCTLPIGVVADERVCSGAMYARLFSIMKQMLKHPEMLETPPEQVFYNEGCEYHVPKPDENTKGILRNVVAKKSKKANKDK